MRIRRWFQISLLALMAWPGGSRGDRAATQQGWLVQETFDQAALAKEFPPKIRDKNKQIVLATAHPDGVRHEGSITVARAPTMQLPESFPRKSPKIASLAGFYTYSPPAKNTVAWHVNFADPDVFAYYGGGLLAQDELQVAEHPMLASVREALLAKRLSTLTVERGSPTPILVMNVPRRVRLATEPDTSAGRPDGLYGNRFARAPAEAVQKAATRIEPPTNSNILAMAAPAHGRGRYTTEQLRHILVTAYTGFTSARRLSENAQVVEIHTGFWGCGAFGGNRTVMLSLQMAAARLAEVDVVFHTADVAGEKDFAVAKAVFEKAAAADVAALLNQIEQAGYRWGTGDGN